MNGLTQRPSSPGRAVVDQVVSLAEPGLTVSANASPLMRQPARRSAPCRQRHRPRTLAQTRHRGWRRLSEVETTWMCDAVIAYS